MGNAEHALGVLKLGIKRLLSRYPVLGGVVARWQLLDDKNIETMGIGLSEKGGYNLYYSPQFVTRIQIDELVGVLHHEVRHLLYGHPFINPKDFPDEQALLVAEEVSVNENLPEPLPGQPIVLASYPQLPPDEDTVARYHRLAQVAPKTALPPAASATASGAGSIPDVSCPSPEATEPSQSSGDASEPGQSSDDHSRWESIRKQQSLAQINLALDLHEAVKAAGELTECEQQIVQKASEECGNEAGRWLSKIDQAAVIVPVNWKKQLRSFIGRELGNEISYKVPPRRLPQFWGIVPGRIRRANRPHILCAIDTSASMSEECLAEVATELTYLARETVISIAECDERVQRTYPYRGRIESFAGRGGTNFRPLLQNTFLREMKAEVLLIFTDGMGPATRHPPQIPMAWVLTTGGEAPVKWGRQIRMNENRVT